MIRSIYNAPPIIYITELFIIVWQKQYHRREHV